MRQRSSAWWLLVPLAVALAACGKDTKAGAGGGKQRVPLAFPVEVQTVDPKPVEYTVSAVGSVDAFDRIQMTARVAGALDKVHFTEGQRVKKGTVVAEIDPKRYRLAVRAARAELEKAKAAKAEAEASMQRREAVNAENPGLIRGEELETFRTRSQTTSAELEAAQVAYEQAQLNLDDALVRAPIDGVLEARTIQTGQYVQVGTVLATIVQREPLLVRFKVPESDAARLTPGMPARFRVRDTREPFSANITYVSAAAEEASRMVLVTAEVTDERKDLLKPGAFAEVVVPVGQSSGAPVVPETAIRPSERGFLAFVVESGVARERVLTLGLSTPDGRREVKAGLQPGEQIVVRGAEALKDGAKVNVVVGGRAADAGATAAGERRALPGGPP